MVCARGGTGLGGRSKRRACRHHIINQQDAAPGDFVPAPGMDANGAGNGRKPLIPVQTIKRPRPVRPLEKVRTDLKPRLLGHALCQQRSLIVPPLDHAQPVKRYGSDQHVVAQDGLGCSRHPCGRRARNVVPVPVFQRKDQFAPVILVQECCAPLRPWPCRFKAIVTDFGRFARLSRKGFAAGFADETRNEWRIPPTWATEAKITVDIRSANRTARRINYVQGRLKPSCHRLIVPAMSELTDRAALIRNRTRASLSRTPAYFLLEAARDEIKDRLELVNKTFKNVAIVGGFPDFWQAAFPGATIVSDDDTLELEEQAHDLIIHAMCLHWANDPVGQLIQIRRALKPDGLFLGALFGGNTLHELRAALGQAEIEIMGGLSPRVAPMAEIRDLGALLQRAGFALPVADSFSITASYASAFDLMHDLRAMGEANAMAARERRGAQRQVMTEAARVYSNQFADADGRIPASFELIFLTGWAPDDSQPKPLRPGSATTRLADALGATEKPLKD